MPSKAYGTFKSNMKQVNKLLDAFVKMRDPKPGRKHLDHFTRAALIFLCSAWEVYIEQIAEETGNILSEKAETPLNMPIPVQKMLASSVKSSKHDLSPVIFADNWKTYYKERITDYTNALNTPKKDKVLELLNKYIGISGERISSDVPSLNKVNKIVSVRGNIAHNIYAEEYLKRETVDGYYTTICLLVKEIELLLYSYLPEVTDGKRPWQNTYK